MPGGLGHEGYIPQPLFPGDLSFHFPHVRLDARLVATQVATTS